jgi:pilus assembly protein Flp/PilA
MKSTITSYVKMQNMLKEEKGATMVEYALMVALIAVVAVGAVTILGGNVSTEFTKIAPAILK